MTKKLTREELEIRMNYIWAHEQRGEHHKLTKQLLRDFVQAVTPERLQEIKADTYSAGVHDGINHAISDIESNTNDLLGEPS